MDQLVPGLPGEKSEPQQQSGELAKTSASNAHQQNVPVAEAQSPAASIPQGILCILISPIINNEIMLMMHKVYYYKRMTVQLYLF
jgi:hypothetical protein